MKKIANLRTASFRGTDNRHIRFTHGSDYRVYDDSGKSYIDFILGLGPVIVGHSNSVFQEKLAAYLKHGLMMPTYASWHEDFVTHYLKGLGKHHSALLFKTGSEAVSAALRLSAMNSRKLGIVRRGYIGWHDAQIANSINWHEEPGSPVRDQAFATGSHFRGIRDEEAVYNWDSDLEQLARIIGQHGDRIGTFVFDCYQFAYVEPAVVQQAVELCRSKGISIVFDETKTGGRISKYGLAHEYGLQPDFIVLGKSLANGAPLSMVVGTNSNMALADLAGVHGTFSKELLSIYCALSTQEIMEEQDGYIALGNICRDVVAAINQAISRAGLQNILRAVQLFGGGMFDLYLAETEGVGVQERGTLPQFLTDEGLLLFLGHPSFVCLEHAQLDYSDLENRLASGLGRWYRSCVSQ